VVHPARGVVWKEENMSKRIKASAFHFGDCSDVTGITKSDFWNWLSVKHGQRGWPSFNPAGDGNRSFYFQQTQRNIFGLLISPDEKIHHVVSTNAQGRSVIVPQLNADGRPSVQLNFFVMRKDFGTGLYANYRGAFPFGQFLDSLWKAYTRFCDETLPRENGRGRYNVSPIFSDVAFRNAVSQLTAVREIHMSSALPLLPNDAPVDFDIKGTRHVYRMGGEPGSSLLSFALWLRERSKVGRRRKGFVLGTQPDEEGVVKIDFENTMDDYLQAVYEEVGEIDVGNLAQHELISRLATVVNRDALFGRVYAR
jgi:hypothetical protein